MLPPRLELACLRVLWQVGEGSVKQVQEELAPHKPLAYTTVMTVLDRLARRGCVQRRKQGRSFVYAPVLTEVSVRDAAVEELVDCFFNGSYETLRAHLQNTEKPAVAAVAAAQ